MSLAVSPPISPDAQQALNQLAGQWSADQQLWASGFLAGMAANSLPATAAEPALRGTVLYGSQSGNGQAVAEALAASGSANNLNLRAVSMADYSPARLKKEAYLLVVVSTHGEGDPPDDALDLFEALADPDGPKFPELNYAVLALGDSSYAQFCQTGRDFDERLAARGASALFERVECDLDYHEPASNWQSKVLEALKERQPQSATPHLQVVPQITADQYNRNRPFPATVEVNQKITGGTSAKDVRHLELSLAESGLSYEPGDSLAVVIDNPVALVDKVLAATGLPADQEVLLNEENTTLVNALTEQRELTRLTRPVLERFAQYSDAPAVSEALANVDQLKSFLFDHQVVDLFQQFPVTLDAQQLVDLLAPITHRSYSIASAQELNPDSVHLTVDALKYEAFGEDHIGAASTTLAELDAGDEVRVYMDPNSRFRLPEDSSAPVIMIGPGTGVAPFRAFLQERDASGADGKNWLFFGHQHFASDFLYQIEWLRWRESGLLNNLSVAFSRDQAEKRYVQHLMEEQGKAFYQWLQDGAYLYVCGDAERMAGDVDDALRALVAEHGGLNPEQTDDYLSDLRRSGRYRRDVY